MQFQRTDYVNYLGTNRDTGIGMIDLTPYTPPIILGSKRDTYSAVIGDEIDINEHLSLISSLQIESNTQYKPYQFNPKIAIVYRYTDTQNYKAIYTRSSRDPNFQELYRKIPGANIGNPYLKPETVDAFEVAWNNVFAYNQYFEVNGYYLINKDRIGKEIGSDTFTNLYDSTIYGCELEYRKLVVDDGLLFLNYAYTSGDKRVQDQSYVASNHQFKAYYLQKIKHNMHAGVIFKYIGESSRLESDPRKEPTDSFALMDLSFDYVEPYTNLNFNMAIKNIFNRSYYIPSEPYTYVDDFKQPGRTYHLSIRRAF